jgi:hypothetical protein
MILDAVSWQVVRPRQLLANDVDLCRGRKQNLCDFNREAFKVSLIKLDVARQHVEIALDGQKIVPMHRNLGNTNHRQSSATNTVLPRQALWFLAAGAARLALDPAEATT